MCGPLSESESERDSERETDSKGAERDPEFLPRIFLREVIKSSLVKASGYNCSLVEKADLRE